MKRIIPFQFSIFLARYEVEILSVDTLGKCIWFGTSSTWSHDFPWNRFLVCELHIRHVTEMIMSSIVSFCQGLSLVQVPTSNHTWKQCCCEVCGGHSLSSGNTVCKKSSTYRELTSWHQEADSCSYQALLFYRSLSLEAVIGEVL